MNRSRWYSYTKYSTWGIICFNILLLSLANRSINMILGIILLIWLFLSSWVVATLIPLLYRRSMEHWWYWFVLLSLYVIAGVITQNTHETIDSLRAIGQSFLVFGTWTVGISLSIQLFKYDFGLKLTAIHTLIWLWMCILIFSQQPSVFDILLRFFVSGEPWFIWWMGALSLTGFIIIPISIVSFFWHTALILWREVQDASPPPSLTGTLEE